MDRRPFAPIPLDVLRRRDIGNLAKLIFARISGYEQGAGVWASDETLGAAVGRSARRVRVALAELERHGIISRQPEGRGRRIVIADGTDRGLRPEPTGTPDGTDRGLRPEPTGTPAGTDRGLRTEPTGTPAGTDRGLRTEPTGTPDGTDRGPRPEPTGTPDGSDQSYKEEKIRLKENNNAVVVPFPPGLPREEHERIQATVAALMPEFGAERIRRALAYCARPTGRPIADWPAYLASAVRQDHAGKLGWTPPAPAPPAPPPPQPPPPPNPEDSYLHQIDFAEARVRIRIARQSARMRHVHAGAVRPPCPRRA